ncbi:hypothetical protein EKO04_008305 [Ascochyta lentis]|uniref:Heterokaryon incompatibility domain-containing protein n=1 Tax=Ascochyta lentis TaxID=205686 RepID=A0A8H7IZC9_9PLEO|nr:hypothetical protein EKO04_008305 [Ascochyta lentis]
MTSSTGTGKVGNDHHENEPSASTKKSIQTEAPCSKKGVIVSWLKSVVTCPSTSPARRLLQKQSRHKTSGHQIEPSHDADIQAQICTINLDNNSQQSVSKISINKSPVAAPCKPLDSSIIKASLEKPPTTPELYKTMPHNDSVRLLRIHKGTPADPVEFTLEFARLDHTAPKYEALSYVWGPELPASHIIHRTSREAVPVTRNLYEALQSVRWCDRDRLLWVDALCINQEDGKEEGTQVRKMNSIYARATRVLVCLGSDADDAADVFGILCALANEVLQKQSHVDANAVEKAQYTTTSKEHEPVVFDAVPNIKEASPWRKVYLFFCRAWYERLWVLQEIVLAREATIVWGDCSISWKYVGMAIEAIRANELLQMILASRGLQNAFFMWYLCTVYHSSEYLQSDDSSQQSDQDESVPFLRLLDLGRTFEVTDPRDKIYGLLGFSTNDVGFSADTIAPDYTLSTSDIYTQVTRDFIEKDQNLNVLALALYISPPRRRPEHCIDDLPSWAPNFNCQTITFPISNMNIGHEYSAGLSQPASLLPSPTRNTLRLKGVQLDTIRTTGPSINFQPLHKSNPHFRLLVKWCLDADISMDKIAATLTAGRNRDGRLLSPPQKEIYLKNLKQVLESYNTDGSAAPATPARFPADTKCEAEEALWRFITYRTPFITQKGEFGLGPWETQEGDAVVVLWGGQCPFVVGAAGEAQWLLKGECFVERWMGGDGVRALVGEEGREDGVFEFL